ncbi:MAG: aminoacetone oxidase family FAD-binding enzyme, partial [Candidatus Omnitrophica bacterium]|nr:aminoacetone oxidase family FAD-binding enzyme [Candidatus Omnitrophota bacterium]
MNNKTVIIVGGGPAGMMAAISASAKRDGVILIERNTSLGKKLLLTGGGRCNMTNACPEQDLIGHYSRTGEFLRDAFKVFGSKELLAFFGSRGLETGIEDDGKVFPVTGKASSVLGVLEKEIEISGVRMLRGKRVKNIIMKEGRAAGIVLEDGSEITGDKVIIASGGLSYSATGASGDGLSMAAGTGHTIIPPRPGLVPLDLEGSIPKDIEGLSVTPARITFRSGKMKYSSDKGSLIFTRSGISGPVTLLSSAKAVDWILRGKTVSVEIDMFPDKSPEEV